MDQPEKMTLGSMVEKTKSESGSGSRDKNRNRPTSSLSDKFSWPGRIAILLAVVLAPWAFASVESWAQRWIMIAFMVALAFWWFETALNDRSSQVFSYMFVPVLIGIVIGLVQLFPLPDWLIQSLTGRQGEIFREYSGDQSASVTISLDRQGTWHQIRLLIIGITGLVLGCRFFRTKRDLILLLAVVAANGAVISFFGIIQKLAGNGKMFWVVEIKKGIPFFGPFVNRNNAAGFLLMCLACCVGLMVVAFAKNKKEGSKLLKSGSVGQQAYYQLMAMISELNSKKIAILMITALVCSGIVATISRGGVAALLGAGLATFVVYGVARKPKNSIFIFIPIVALVVALTAWLGVADKLLKRVEQVGTVDVIESDDRLPHWKETWSAVGDMGILGSGLGSYANVHRIYRSDHEVGIFIYAENQFFQSVVEAGWPGLIVFLLAWVLAFQYCWMLLFKGNSPTSIAAGTMGFFLLFSQMLASMVDFGFYIGANLTLFSVLIGFLSYHSQSLGGRLKEKTWLRFSAPNYVVQITVLLLFFGATLVALNLHRLAGFETLSRPRAKDLSRANMDLVMVEDRISAVEKGLQNTKPISAMNYLGDLYLHRSRLELFQDLKTLREELNPGFGDSRSEEEKVAEKRKVHDVLWELTDLQRVQEHASVLKRTQTRYSTELNDFLNSEPIKGNLPNALFIFLQSRELAPLQPIVHLRIGEIRGALSDADYYGTGDEDIERALELAPSNANFRLVAGVHYLQSGKPNEAAPHLRRYLELQPLEFDDLMRLITGRETRSLTLVSEDLIGREIIPDDPKMLYQYVANYMPPESDSKKFILERAKEILANQEHTRREFNVLAGDIAVAQRQLEPAIEEYKLALISRPNDPATRLKLGKALVELDRIDEALEELDHLARQGYKNHCAELTKLINIKRPPEEQ